MLKKYTIKSPGAPFFVSLFPAYLDKKPIRLDEDTVEYFKEMSEESGIKYQQLINLYLADCAKKKLKLHIDWKAS